MIRRAAQLVALYVLWRAWCDRRGPPRDPWAGTWLSNFSGGEITLLGSHDSADHDHGEVIRFTCLPPGQQTLAVPIPNGQITLSR